MRVVRNWIVYVCAVPQQHCLCFTRSNPIPIIPRLKADCWIQILRPCAHVSGSRTHNNTTIDTNDDNDGAARITVAPTDGKSITLRLPAVQPSRCVLFIWFFFQPLCAHSVLSRRTARTNWTSVLKNVHGRFDSLVSRVTQKPKNKLAKKCTFF